MEQNLDPHGIRPPKARSCEQFQGQLFKNENSFEEWKLVLEKQTYTTGAHLSPFKNENSFEEWKPSGGSESKQVPFKLFKNENSFEEWKLHFYR